MDSSDQNRQLGVIPPGLLEELERLGKWVVFQKKVRYRKALKHFRPDAVFGVAGIQRTPCIRPNSVRSAGILFPT